MDTRSEIKYQASKTSPGLRNVVPVRREPGRNPGWQIFVPVVPGRGGNMFRPDKGNVPSDYTSVLDYIDDIMWDKR